MKSLLAREERESKLDRIGDPLAALDATVDFQTIADRVAALLPKADNRKGERAQFQTKTRLAVYNHQAMGE